MPLRRPLPPLWHPLSQLHRSLATPYRPSTPICHRLMPVHHFFNVPRHTLMMLPCLLCICLL